MIDRLCLANRTRLEVFARFRRRCHSIGVGIAAKDLLQVRGSKLAVMMKGLQLAGPVAQDQPRAFRDGECLCQPLAFLFVCVENCNRSQMAEAFARIFGSGRVKAYSAGIRPAAAVHTKAVEAMRELGYDLEQHRSKGLCQLPTSEFDVAVTMGCGDQCLALLAKRREDWDIPSPKQMPSDQFRLVRDEIGAKVKAQGMHFGYHNHVGEFAEIDGKTPYFELMRLADPKKVVFELDCGWASVAGRNPIEIMKAHPHRIAMLHVKDFTLPAHPSPESHEAKVTELGHGSVDYHPIFAEAARSQHIEYAFVEQEAFTMPWKESLKVDADYLRGFKG